MINQEQLYAETMALYSEKGSKFTMDELAARLCISKKTLYEMVRSKEELAVQVIEYYFTRVADIQNAIHKDSTLSNVEKIKRLLCATPDLPLRKYHLHEMNMNLPQAYAVMDERLRYGWEQTLSVIEKAKSEGAIREIDTALFIQIYAAAIEEILDGNDITNPQLFKKKQAEIVDMLLNGICAK